MNYQRLMEIDLMSMAVFHGTGRTGQEADDMVSKCAMRYLQSQMEAGNPKKPEGDDETEDDIAIVKVIDAKERESPKHEAQHRTNKTFEGGQVPRRPSNTNASALIEPHTTIPERCKSCDMQDTNHRQDAQWQKANASDVKRKATTRGVAKRTTELRRTGKTMHPNQKRKRN